MEQLEIYRVEGDEESRAYIEYDENSLALHNLILPVSSKCPHILITHPDGSELVRVPMYSEVGVVDLSSHTLTDIGSVGIEEIFNG